MGCCPSREADDDKRLIGGGRLELTDSAVSQHPTQSPSNSLVTKPTIEGSAITPLNDLPTATDSVVAAPAPTADAAPAVAAPTLPPDVTPIVAEPSSAELPAASDPSPSDDTSDDTRTDPPPPATPVETIAMVSAAAHLRAAELHSELLRAVEAGDAAGTAAALAHGADLNAASPSPADGAPAGGGGAAAPPPMPPLVLAAFRGHSAVVETLLDHGAEVNQADAHGGTALIAAAFAGHAAVVELLCTRGADGERQTKDGGHALAAAALRGDSACLRVLLAQPYAEATVNLLDGRKASPIMLAAQSGHIGVVKMLVEAGGDPDLVDASSKTAMDYARDGARVRRRRGELDEAMADAMLARMQRELQTISRTTTGLRPTLPRLGSAKSDNGGGSGKWGSGMLGSGKLGSGKLGS